ncbi:MAG TPA: ABC transporter [Propionibacteriaceae bacterium]|nr:ABC transporter [Propionibacteriaceae bacterium]
MSAAGVSGALTELREALLPVRLPLPLPDAADRARLAGEIARQLDDYILPRLADIEAPVLAVVGGSTGAGKSTLVNTLIGRVVSTPGVIRPTTRSPVLVHHPDDARWFDTERILPGLIRSRVSSADANSLQLVAEPTLPRGLALLDAPDVDSVVASNRRLAAQLLQAADLWLFTTSAARYADAVPWDFLHSAVDRHAAVAVVLNRVPPGAMAQVPAHLGQLMTERGLAEAPLFAVPETPPDAEGLLPDAAVAPIRTWLATLAADQASRQRVVLQTLDGAIGSVASRAPLVAAALDEQAEALDQLRSDADRSFAEAVRAIGVQSADGTLLRGEVLSRWHEFVGTGDVMRALDEKVSWLRDRVWGSIKGTPPEAKHVGVAVEAGLEALVRDEADAAAERAEAAWQATPAGREVLRRLAGSGIDLARVSPEFPAQAARAIRDWQGDVMELVAGEGMGKRSRARFLALGVNGASVALMVAVFAHTGGLTGAEVGIAGGSSVIAQRLLESVFGDEAIRRLAERAKSELDARISGLLAAELARYDDALTGLAPDGSVADRIRRAAALVEEARTSGYSSSTAVEGPASGAPELGGETRVNQVTAAADADVVEAELVEHPEPERQPEDRP